MLRVVVESASGLPKKKLGSPDPITSVVFKGETKKTRSISSEINPVWKETLEFDLKGSPLDSSSFIDVIVKDFETLGKDNPIPTHYTPTRENEGYHMLLLGHVKPADHIFSKFCCTCKAMGQRNTLGGQRYLPSSICMSSQKPMIG